VKLQPSDVTLSIRSRWEPHDNRGGDDSASSHQWEVKRDFGAEQRAILRQPKCPTNNVGTGEDFTIAGKESGTDDTSVLITQTHHSCVKVYGHADSRSIPPQSDLEIRLTAGARHDQPSIDGHLQTEFHTDFIGPLGEFMQLGNQGLCHWSKPIKSGIEAGGRHPDDLAGAR